VLFLFLAHLTSFSQNDLSKKSVPYYLHLNEGYLGSIDLIKLSLNKSLKLLFQISGSEKMSVDD